MKYAEIKYCDIANGVGVRTTLFVSGCLHHCKGCFNEVAWNFDYGKDFDYETENAIIDSVKPSYISGLTLLGGEPFEVKNQEGLLPFLKRFKVENPDKSIWCYSGFTYEELIGEKESRCRSSFTDEVLALIDVLVDGKFVLEEKDITLRFRGSRNQRIIDLNKTRESGKLSLWEDEPIFASHSL